MRTVSKAWQLFNAFCILALTGCGKTISAPGERFDGHKALGYVEQQMQFGPRTPGSDGHELTRDLILETLQSHGWDVEVQQEEYQNAPIVNIIGSRKSDAAPDALQYIIIGAHYDTRIFADRSADPGDRTLPVPGANDGASGVAILLELSRVLPEYKNLLVQLVFFDAEDNGNISGRDWIVGSEIYAEMLTFEPNAVVVVDMIGDKDQEIYMERSSDPALREEIWTIAPGLGIDSFIPEEKYHILDDHTPFLRRGIPAVDLIDFDYPYWHTTEDTLDKISASSLENVGVVLQEWLNYRDSLGDE